MIRYIKILNLELLEALLSFLSLAYFQDVKPHSLAQWTALANSDNVSKLDIPAKIRFHDFGGFKKLGPT